MGRSLAQVDARLTTEILARSEGDKALDAKIAALAARVAALEAGETSSPTTPTSPLTDLPGWKLAFADEFDRTVAKGQFTTGGTVVRWVDKNGVTRTAGVKTADGRYIAFGSTPGGSSNWADTSKHGTYADSTIIEIRDGKLIEHVYADANGYGHTSVFSPLPVGSSPRGGIIGGRSLIRARADLLPGFKGVPLWWADEAVDNDMLTYGEIDGPEGPFNETPKVFMHYKGGSSPSDQSYASYPAGTKWQDWHDYVTEWIAGVSVEYFIDGVSFHKVTSRIPTDRFHFNFQLETNTGSGPWPAAGTAGVVEIERIGMWVRV